MAVRNRTRAQRRNAERQRRNAAAVAAGAALAEDRPRSLRIARSKSSLEALHARGSLSTNQLRAGDRLAMDYRTSKTDTTRLVGKYEANMPRPPKGVQYTSDGLRSIEARERFEAALRYVGPWLSDILVHVCVCDRPASEWGPLNGRAPSHGVPVLALALDALAHHYGLRRAAA